MGARRTTRVVAGVVSAGAVAAAITVVNLPDARSSPDPAKTTPVTTTEITKQTLTDRENHGGTLGHGDTTTISSRGDGTVTGLPAEGATVIRGAALFRLDNKPVTLLYGSLPAYRTLSAGVKGTDVTQFEQNLWALGYRGFTADETYNASTASAVSKWQKDLGLIQTGSVDPSQIVYATGEVRVDSLSLQVGAVVGPGAAVEKVTGTAPLVTAELEMASARLAKQGAPVQITPADGKPVPGQIIKVVTVVSPGENGDGYTTKIHVTIGFTSAVQSPGPAAVTVAFTAGERPDVLAVPVAALLALAEGGYGVQVVEGDATRIVAVETGLFADGKVEVTGNGVQAGMRVAVPS
ncbi:peptidoglycan hydrolase-like protein with peptidoglycan-binding domain [Kibdelosporangium banguiense]|uniref:Peptidoglycan hydrolase-like protein with peptidoglycan-binding domain n=1 Tax=Kibdelosporangium banguiense TaxID=1365924 RepID=A0ABS4TMJ3_9PSEU|nr:peptidoglycan-binding protein [Kibdelosporangium banguiense]MBP2325626.1 peptidoglycan hydrolase-like protein with peptidoglycan-binding domain [Kibdelosporangium banguiense]